MTSKIPESLQKFMQDVSNELPSEGYAFDWLLLIEIGLSLLEGCLNRDRQLALWRQRLNGRFAAFWTERAEARIRQAANEQGFAGDHKAVAAAIVKKFKGLSESAAETLSADLS